MRSPGAAFDLRAALSEELRAAIDELSAPQLDPKAVHHCRVRVKRARALARVGRSCAPGLASVFVDSARALMRSLAPVRDAAALSEAARATAKGRGKRDKRALKGVAVALDEASAALPSINVESARAGLKDLLALAQVWPEASPRQIRKGARRLEHRAKRARRRGRESVDPVRRHDWRSAEKDRYYAALLLDEAWPGKRRLSKGEELGNLLGAERDALLLVERLSLDPDLVSETKTVEHAVKVISRRRAKLARRANKVAERMVTA